MIKKISDRTNESYYYIEHSSGLPIYVYPKDGYNATYAIFGTRYGSINTKFKSNGEVISVPDGTAHYLEHKLFESEDGDAFTRYAKTGASANAFTSFDQTCYLFSCTENFKESLEILLDFVQSPYFTDETVQKEQGIIGQEIGMYADDPNWMVMFNLLRCLYHEHPVKIDIAGTVESIAKITPKTLYDCYNAYYNLHNMALCIVGNVDVDEVLKIADKTLKPVEKVEVESLFPSEPKDIVKSHIEQEFPIAVQMFELGFKEDVSSDRVNVHDTACTDILLEAFASKSSKLYEELLNLQLINTASFGYEYFEGPGFATVIFSGESENPEKVAEIIRAHADKLHEDKIDAESFERSKRAVYGRTLASLNNIEAIGTGIINGHFSGIGLFEYIEAVANLRLEDVNQRLNHELLSEYSALSIVRPIRGN